MPPHLEESINQVQLEKGTYEQMVIHLEKEIELKCLEAPDELQINQVSHKTSNKTAGRPKPTCYHCKKPGNYRNQCRLIKRQKEKLKTLKIILAIKTVAFITLSQITIQTPKTTTTTKTVTELKKAKNCLSYL